MMVALNLMKGLDSLHIPYRFNDYKYINQHPDETACIIGKPHLLFKKKWKNPVVFGAGIFSHPSDEPDLLARCPTIKRILVPGPWMVKMFRPFYGDMVSAWPTGIDTERWSPDGELNDKPFDFLIYDKIRWERGKYVPGLLQPILDILSKHQLKYTVLKYGTYAPADLKSALSQSKAAIFLCEHETQGLAYQQILATDTPILAWDRGRYWQDPSYYPRIQFGPVSSVPYWSDGCGLKFASIQDFEMKLNEFLKLYQTGVFKPREYILENLTLEKCAANYVNIVQSTQLK
jgi:glycosyltransferase involved in cell wall biosynthesis